jgi:hypothetical protein
MTLLKDPKRGLKLIDDMFEECWSVIVEKFWPHRDKLFHGEVTLEELRGHVISGFNYPPSQYQLHMQFMLPPFLPFQWHLCEKGVHFTKDRFFPYEYVRAVLNCPTHFAWNESSTVYELFEFYTANHQVDYHQFHADGYQRYFASHKKLANWAASAFEGVVMDKSFVPFANEAGDLDYNKKEDVENPDAQAAADKMVLQNYGRAYTDAGKPSGTYYKHAKASLDFF